MHLAASVLCGANAVISFSFLYADIIQFFTFINPGLSLDVPFFKFPNAMISVAVALSNKYVSPALFPVAWVLQVATDYNIGCIQKGIDKINKDDEDVNKTNKSALAFKIILYLIQILQSFLNIVFVQFFTDLYGKYPVISIFLLPVFFMLSTLRIFGYLKYRFIIIIKLLTMCCNEKDGAAL